MVGLLTVGTLLAACTAEPVPSTPPPEAAPAATTPSGEPGSTTPAEPSDPAAAPVWRVGARPLPLRPDGYGQVLPTPPELVDRALPTADLLPPPQDGRYAATVRPVPADVLARSSWRPECPVAAADLRYLTMSFRGFDGRAHTGEMLVNASVAEAVTTIFGELFAAGFPIEEMRVTRADELDAPPTGDGNNTSAFVCRPVRGRTTWSAHAHGLAIDVNPFCNPYLRGDLVLPELASAYVDRSRVRPGMLLPSGPAVRAFRAAGWTWGGTWTDPKDLMHFSANGG
ncbi:D-alanyl-D-alanine carboxypeptidase [Amycolatopsis arida]|uniref:D-alanyl-D-alanine carboxypeptidase n=1 Tax=Amycolatopsis arida TaxID=587909 RepID=A0A1I5KLE9_9PSEU|nr:D-alanyl-D-alanine carboxypeptidase-like protein [Amycolatopsis arida]SFO85486.1 D-alanyl-D-alanine carboxypeptidase [Amycolatopsis arida]